MNLEELKKIPRFANCADEAAVMVLLGETAEKADKADALEKENGELKQQLQQQEESRINDLVESAVTDGRIGADQKEAYKNILKADFTNGQAVLKGLKPKKMVQNKLEAPAGDAGSPWEKRMGEIRANIKK